MKNLNLEKLWEVCNKLSYEQSKLAEEKDIYVNLLGVTSNYTTMSFENFLKYYSFSVEKGSIIVFNDDKVQWEDYTVGDFSFIPICLLSFNKERLENWMGIEIKLQLETQERQRMQERENIKKQIEQLQKQLGEEDIINKIEQVQKELNSVYFNFKPSLCYKK